MKLSICIPTYNRAEHLTNCLNSLKTSGLSDNVQICISDNCSTDETKKVVDEAMRHIAIKYSRNENNLGLARNIIKVSEMADGEFIWMIGDDDLLLENAVQEVLLLIEENKKVDYFFVNSCHLTTEYVFSFPQPFLLSNLPKSMKPFSKRKESGLLPFMDLINPHVSFDFLGGIFLSVFRRENWLSSLHVIDQNRMLDHRLFSNFDNTFPHVKVFASAFANSLAYFHAKPVSICLTGAREWTPMYCLIKSIRLVEAVEYYRAAGLPFLQYLKCKNAALNSFIPDMAYLCLRRKTSGFKYINPLSLAFRNSVYPNVYLSPFYFLLRKLNRALRRIIGRE